MLVVFRLLLSFSFDLKHSVKHPFIISRPEKHKEKRTGSLSTFISTKERERERKKQCTMQDICLHLVNQQKEKKERSTLKSRCNDPVMQMNEK